MGARSATWRGLPLCCLLALLVGIALGHSESLHDKEGTTDDYRGKQDYDGTFIGTALAHREE